MEKYEPTITERLKEPFDPSVVHWRIGHKSKDGTSAMVLAYVDARDVMKRLDDVMGDDWQNRYPYEGCCEIGLKINGEWLWRANGAGETNVEGEKGQYSDAFKRAAVNWGVARYLYYLPTTWVKLDASGNFTAPGLPNWAKPGYRRFNKGETDAIRNGMLEALQAGDELKAAEIYGEYANDQQEIIKFWTVFNSSEKSAIKQFLGVE